MPKKHSFEYVKEYMESFGYTLLSDKYINSKTKLKIQCPTGHIYDVKFNSFKNGNRCPVCFGTPKHTLEYVKNYIEDNGFKLLSTEYKNNSQLLEMLCPNNHKCKIRFYNFKTNGTRCPVCFGNKKYTFSYVKEYIEKSGYELLSTEYNSVYEKLQVKCLNGHIYETTFSNFKKGYRCSRCKTSGPELEVFEYVKSIYDGDIIQNDRETLVNPETNHWLELDVYLPKINKAIEFNGYYHYLEDHKKRDEIKVEQCIQNKIELFVINGWEYKKNKEHILSSLDIFINKL
jgi:hypothetical protein